MSENAEILKLREALKPFADFAEALKDETPDAIALGIFAGGALRFGPNGGCDVGALRRALSALSGERSLMSEWQPIETAPKDGTEIIAAFHLWGDETKPYGMQVVSFEDGAWSNEAYPIWSPTHWMPLPAAPDNHQKGE